MSTVNNCPLNKLAEFCSFCCEIAFVVLAKKMEDESSPLNAAYINWL